MASSTDDDKGKDDGDDLDNDQNATGEDEPSDESADEKSEASPKSPSMTDLSKPAAQSPSPSGPEPRRAAPPRPPPSAGLGKSVAIFVAVVGGISVLMLALGNERGTQGPAAPKWTDGQVVDVDITLVSTDRQDLACATGTELKGLHCQFESQTKRWSKPDANDDKKMLKPYSTTNGINFLAAGVWSDPALSGENLPKTRFAVKCKLTVAGKMPRADVRWHEGEGWNNVSDWYTGSVSDCKMGAAQQ